jgi:hypothetical protein
LAAPIAELEVLAETSCSPPLHVDRHLDQIDAAASSLMKAPPIVAGYPVDDTGTITRVHAAQGHAPQTTFSTRITRWRVAQGRASAPVATPQRAVDQSKRIPLPSPFRRLR